MKKWLLILLGSLSWSWTMVKSGLFGQYGMGFWGANGHDGVWHIALSESLSRGTLSAPIFSGRLLQNYHLGFDIVLAVLHKLTSIPTVNLYFQIIPPILAVLIGFLTYQLVLKWNRSEKSAFLSTFFVYFGGSFAWVIGKGESAFWSQQAVSTLINPPFALSIVVLLVGLLILIKDKKTILDFIISMLLFGILIEIKAYAGVLVLGALFVSGIYQFIKEKKKDLIIIFLGSLTVSLILFAPSLKSSSGLFVWQPFWFLETMMGLSDRLGWEKFFSAMSNYKAGHVWLKAIPAYTIAFIIFWIGNMGLRISQKYIFIKWVRNFKQVTWVEVFISSIILAGGVIPMLFLQRGTPWNTIQFFYYSLFFSSILAGVAISEFIKKTKSNTSMYQYIEVLIILLTLPTTILTLKDVYIPARPPAMVSREELSALNFLRSQPDGVVLTHPFDPIKAKEAESNPPRPLYLYTSTAYVSAFSGHQTFLEDEINLDILGFDWVSRRREVDLWYKEPDQTIARQFLAKNNIKYIYWLKGQRAYLGEGQLGLNNIFENNQAIIYRVN